MANTSPASEFSWVPNPASGISSRFVKANGLTFELAEAGDRQARKLAILLHGFPELNFSWRHQIPELAAKGWRIWAPNMRGYGASSKPEGIAAYRIDTLLQDVAALIDLAKKEATADEVMLVAHDWGAIVAWMFAIRQVRPIDRLVIMNVPHPKCAEREIRHWRQIRKSWYIYFFQLPWLPEKMLLRNDAEPIRSIFTASAANKHLFSHTEMDIYARAAQRPYAMQAMVNYYRALLRHQDMRKTGDAMVHLPTLVIWGENDLALDIHLLDGMQQWVPDLTLHRLPGISHWVQQDAPDEVNRVLSEWLAGTS
ncbi:MAG: alpha/beta fold hydrolase [Sphingorhabdus sp.]